MSEPTPTLPTARVLALARMMTDEGHMTPYAYRQFWRLAHEADTVADGPPRAGDEE